MKPEQLLDRTQKLNITNATKVALVIFITNTILVDKSTLNPQPVTWLGSIWTPLRFDGNLFPFTR